MRRSIASLSVVLLSLSYAVASPTGASSEEPRRDESGLPSVDQVSVAAAQALRAQMGLRSDAGYVVELARNRVAIDPFLQIPVTPEEAADVARREQVGSRFIELETAAVEDGIFEFGGVYMDQPGGGVAVVLATADTARLRSIVERVLPAGARYRTKLAANSYVELLNAHDEVLRRLGNGKTLLSASPVAGAYVTAETVDIINNVVVLKVDASRSHPNFEKAVVDELGLPPQMVAVSADDDFQPRVTAVSRYATTGSLYGGGRLVNATNGSSCTNAGSGVNGTPVPYIVTAGHCGSHPPVWRQGSSSGPSLGWGHGNGFFDYPTSYCDCQSVGGAVQGKETNDVLDAWNNVQNEYHQASAGLYWIGQITCLSGATSNGVRCGPILNPSYNYNLPIPGRTVGMFDQVLTDADVCNGDSGGAVTVGTTWAGVQSGRVANSTFTTTSPDIGVQDCYPSSTFSKMLPHYLSFYTGITAMRTS